MRWAGGETVEVQTAAKVTHTAHRVILTVPLGVLKASIAADSLSSLGTGTGGIPLQRGVITFQPRLPSSVVHAASRLGLGRATKAALRFPHVFWPPDAHVSTPRAPHHPLSACPCEGHIRAARPPPFL